MEHYRGSAITAFDEQLHVLLAHFVLFFVGSELPFKQPGRSRCIFCCDGTLAHLDNFLLQPQPVRLVRGGTLRVMAHAHGR